MAILCQHDSPKSVVQLCPTVRPPKLIAVRLPGRERDQNEYMKNMFASILAPVEIQIGRIHTNETNVALCVYWTAVERIRHARHGKYVCNVLRYCELTELLDKYHLRAVEHPEGYVY